MPLLFSYGTLREERVQLDTFGRLLQSAPDALVGFEPALVQVHGATGAVNVGKTYHANVIPSSPQSRVPGTVFEVTDAELAAADEYELPAGYRRISVNLASGKQAWVYVHAPEAGNKKAPPGLNP